MFDLQVSTLLSGRLLQKALNNEPLTLAELNILTTSLIAQNIPFEVAFVSGTRKSAASVQVTIHINPSTTLVFVISLEQGSTIFTPSP